MTSKYWEADRITYMDMLTNNTDDIPLIEDIIEFNKLGNIIFNYLFTNSLYCNSIRHIILFAQSIGIDPYQFMNNKSIQFYNKQPTLEEMSKEWGLTKERIRQLRNKVFRYLRHNKELHKLFEQFGLLLYKLTLDERSNYGFTSYVY